MRLGGPLEPVLLDACLMGGQAFRWQPVEDGYLGVVDGHHVHFRAHANGSVAARAHPRLHRDALARYLGLDPAYDAACATLAEDPGLRDAVQRYKGLRLLEQDPWETLVAFVTSANNNVRRISLTMERLATAAGAPREGPWGAYHAFPEPDAVAALTERDLRGLGFGYRAPYVRETARAVASGDVDLAALRGDADLDATRDALTALPGVGPKVAECVALFGLGKGDAFPVDRWIARAVSDAFFHGRAVTPAAAGAFARERWGPLAGLAQQFLFHAARMRGREADAQSKTRHITE